LKQQLHIPLQAVRVAPIEVCTDSPCLCPWITRRRGEVGSDRLEIRLDPIDRREQVDKGLRPSRYSGQSRDIVLDEPEIPGGRRGVRLDRVEVFGIHRIERRPIRLRLIKQVRWLTEQVV